MITSIARRASHAIKNLSPAYRLRYKYETELQHWREEIAHLAEWFNGKTDWWGIPPPRPEQKITSNDLWSVNAILTMHRVRPSYWEELKLPGNQFEGQRVLEVGCGALVPILQFEGCERHGIDPLVNAYTKLGWPLYALDAKIINAHGEHMPYPDAYFDTVISVNALDHVDDFDKVTTEMQRVLKPGGRLYIEVEYHEATVAEPLELTDEIVKASFQQIRMNKIVQRGKRDMFMALKERFSMLDTPLLKSFDNTEQFVTWHGVKR